MFSKVIVEFVFSKMEEKNEIVLKIEFIIVKRTDHPPSGHSGQRFFMVVHVEIRGPRGGTGFS